MEQSFDSIRYVVDVGRELVASFAQAGHATSPGQVGSAREAPTRRQLKHLLPNGVAVGSGFVIDSYGGTSRQIDVVLYEEQICPAYSVNDDLGTTYYPCEGVIAVGEVKSDVGSREIKDIFAKIASVKKLRRHGVAEDDGLGPVVPFRHYGSSLSAAGTEEEQFDQANKSKDQIFGFAIGASLGTTPATFCEKYREFSTEVGRAMSPNLIVTLEDDQVVCPLGVSNGKATIVVSPQEADHIYCVRRPEGVFQFLLSRLHWVYRAGRTTSRAAFDRYFSTGGELTLPGGGELRRIQ